jgi:hypothetical protein
MTKDGEERDEGTLRTRAIFYLPLMTPKSDKILAKNI